MPADPAALALERPHQPNRRKFFPRMHVKSGGDMKDVSILARFPEERYQRNGQPLEIMGRGTGSSLAVAISRAVRDMLQSPEMRHKSPLHIYISVAIDGEQPIQFWQYFRRS
jgi:hypothetical protein